MGLLRLVAEAVADELLNDGTRIGLRDIHLVQRLHRREPGHPARGQRLTPALGIGRGALII
jgi:hypothetical protein